MLGDAIAAKKSSGEAADTLEVVDVAQLLAQSVVPVRAAVTDPPGSAPISDDAAGVGD